MALTLPDTAVAGDAGHVSDHNLITSALTDLQTLALGTLRGTAPTVRESVPRWFSTNLSTLTSGQAYAVAVPVVVGDIVTSITFVTATTAMTWGSNNDGHIWFALYSGSATPTLLGQTADQTGVQTWGASTAKTLNLSSPYTVTATGFLYAAVMVNIGTGGSPAVPTLRGAALLNSPLSASPVTGMLRPAWQAGSGLTTTAETNPTPATNGNVTYAVFS